MNKLSSRSVRSFLFACGALGALASTFTSHALAAAPDAPCSTRIKQIALGSQTSYALAEDGTVWAWGSNNWDALGNGAPLNAAGVASMPVRVPVGRATRISAGGSGACAILEGGTVSCWGLESDDGVPVEDASPQPIQQISGAIGIAQGGAHACAWKGDGTVWCWGNNFDGEGGNGAGEPIYDTATQVQGLTDVIDVVTAARSTCVLTRGGEVDCFGSEGSGQLGDGVDDQYNDNPIPTKVPLAAKAHALYGGGERGTYCAATSDGTYCWGWGRFGTAGTGTDTAAIPSPVAVTIPIPSHTRLAFGTVTCGWHHDGRGACWGYGANGQLVNGGADSLVPAPVAASRHIDAIAVGSLHACLLSDGEVMCWGRNPAGQLGNGATSFDVSAPAVVRF
jgi:alpha-tubulin suppressor-like RCC1 family protein